MIADKLAKTAEECVGKHRDEVRCAGDYPWCAGFGSYVLNECGIDMYDRSCTSMQNKMSESPDWDEPEDYMKRGDYIFFDWDRDPNEALPLDHVGIVVDFDDKTHTVTYINGNGSSSEYVTKQTINGDSPQIAYWMRYVGDSKHPPDVDENGMYQPEKRRLLRKGSKGTDVKKIQRLLFAEGYDVGADDGDFGTRTDKYVREFQKDHKLEVDGIVGHDTFEELMK